LAAPASPGWEGRGNQRAPRSRSSSTSRGSAAPDPRVVDDLRPFFLRGVRWIRSTRDEETRRPLTLRADAGRWPLDEGTISIPLPSRAPRRGLEGGPLPGDARRSGSSLAHSLSYQMIPWAMRGTVGPEFHPSSTAASTDRGGVRVADESEGGTISASSGSPRIPSIGPRRGGPSARALIWSGVKGG